ncbi:GL19958 [Drosophila persimilis]|uniref:GL19958 n=1 Tax=Drosophila persimilis TaxID=7234 RepID=B4GYN4_DROPE|nr:GL19958 [Drosophila persimilis]
MRFLWLMGLIVAGALFEASASKCSKRRPRTCAGREPTNVDDNSDSSEDCDGSDATTRKRSLVVQPPSLRFVDCPAPPAAPWSPSDDTSHGTTRTHSRTQPPSHRVAPPIVDCQPTCSTWSPSDATSPGTTRTTAEPATQPPCGCGNEEEEPCGATTQPPIVDCQPTCSTWSPSEATSPGTTRTTAEPTTQPPCGCGNGEEVPCGPTTQPPIVRLPAHLLHLVTTCNTTPRHCRQARPAPLLNQPLSHRVGVEKPEFGSTVDANRVVSEREHPATPQGWITNSLRSIQSSQGRSH